MTTLKCLDGHIVETEEVAEDVFVIVFCDRAFTRDYVAGQLAKTFTEVTTKRVRRLTRTDLERNKERRRISAAALNLAAEKTRRADELRVIGTFEGDAIARLLDKEIERLLEGEPE